MKTIIVILLIAFFLKFDIFSDFISLLIIGGIIFLATYKKR